MDLEDLRLIQANERSSKGLQEIGHNFYGKVRAYINVLEDKKEGAVDSERMLIDNELRNIRNVVDDIFRRRTGKIIKMATTKAFGLDISPEGATPGEEEIFEQLVDLIRTSKVRIMEPVSQAKKIKTTERSLLKRKNVGEDFRVVRILRDIPVFMGADGRSYELSGQDVVVLPKVNAKALCSRHAAEDISNGMSS